MGPLDASISSWEFNCLRAGRAIYRTARGKQNAFIAIFKKPETACN
jgi:hypothetical protein